MVDHEKETGPRRGLLRLHSGAVRALARARRRPRPRGRGAGAPATLAEAASLSPRIHFWAGQLLAPWR